MLYTFNQFSIFPFQLQYFHTYHQRCHFGTQPTRGEDGILRRIVSIKNRIRPELFIEVASNSARSITKFVEPDADHLDIRI